MIKKFDRKNLIFALVATGLFMAFLVGVLPQEAAKGEALGLVEGIDSAFFYQVEDLNRIVSAYGETGRAFYIAQRFSFDVIWPLVYSALIWTWLNVWLTSKRSVLWLTLFPLIFDYLENLSVVYVMWRYPTPAPVFAFLATVFTPLKWLTLYLALGLVMSLWIIGPFVRFKERQR